MSGETISPDPDAPPRAAGDGTKGSARKRGARYWATLVSLVFPGVGQAYLGAVGRGLAFAAAALCWGVLYRLSPYGATEAPGVVRPAVVSVLVLAGIGLALWAGVDAFAVAREGGKRPMLERWLIYAVCIVAPAIPGLTANIAWAHYVVPTASMLPTLLVGDHVFAVEGYYDRFEPQRGELVTFHGARDPSTLFIKRIIGLPGEHVQMKAGRLVIDGVTVPVDPVESFAADPPDCRTGTYPQFIETLPGGAKHRVLRGCGPGFFRDTAVFDVPDGHYFMLGDNRDNSDDSRDPKGGVGIVARSDLVARAVFVTYSTAGLLRWSDLATLPSAIRWRRTDLPLE